MAGSSMTVAGGSTGNTEGQSTLPAEIKSKETDEVLDNKNRANQYFVAVGCFSSPCSVAISTLSYSWTPLRRKNLLRLCSPAPILGRSDKENVDPAREQARSLTSSAV